jgi:hypothetical protein
MHIGYVVLYVKDAEDCLKFWTEKVGMVAKGSKTAGPFEIHKVGFEGQRVSFELVPLELMKVSSDKNLCSVLREMMEISRREMDTNLFSVRHLLT